MRVFGGLGGLKNTIIIEGTQQFILVWAIEALRRAPDDPLLVLFSVSRRNPQAHGYTVVALHPEVFRVS